MLDPGVSQDQAVFPAEFVGGITRPLLEHTLPFLIEYKVSTVFVGWKSGLGIVALGLAWGKIFSKRIIAAPRLSRGRKILDGGEQSFQILVDRLRRPLIRPQGTEKFCLLSSVFLLMWCFDLRSYAAA